MLNQKKPQNILTYRKTLLGCGPIQDKSNISQLKEVTEDTSLIQNTNQVLENLYSRNEEKSSTLVFHLENKKMTLKDKQNISNKNTPTIPSYQTLAQASTSKEQGLRGFWKESLRVTSKKLWLPTKTALADLDTHCLNGFSNNTIQSSFLIQNQRKMKTKNSQMTSWLSSLYSLQDTTVEESIKNVDTVYCRKIRFYPTFKHKILLEKCFGATRFLINQALENIKSNKIEKVTNVISIRNTLKYQDKYLTDDNLWLKEIPYDTRDGAIRQMCSNFKAAFTHLKKGIITSFKMKFKSKRNPVQVCFLNKKALNVKKKTLFVRRIKEPISFKENIENFEFGSLTVVREKNRYYMCFPLKRKSSNKKTKFKVVALDPGVRTFQTFYSEGLVGKLGDNTINRLKSIYTKEDKLKSHIKQTKKKKTRYNLRKRCFLLRTKVKNIVRDMHRKSCNWLTSNFKEIFLPSFNVKKMVKKKDRVIGRSTVRSMLALSHFSFKERLLFTAKSRGCNVHICNEAYTSKTCGRCGKIKDNLGGNKVFKCSNCFIEIDRDYNGARNIYLKNIPLQGSV